MHLTIYIEDQPIQIEIPDHILQEGGEFFDKMDRDMDQGWRMGPTYIEHPDRTMRAQIAADRILTAIDTENSTLMHLMAGYIVSRIPEIKAVRIDTSGDPLNTEIIT